jgi:hypothetical protein
MLTLHHTDAQGRERFIAVSDVRYLPKGPGERAVVHFVRCDGSNEATGFANGRVDLINEGGGHDPPYRAWHGARGQAASRLKI